MRSTSYLALAGLAALTGCTFESAVLPDPVLTVSLQAAPGPYVAGLPTVVEVVVENSSLAPESLQINATVSGDNGDAGITLAVDCGDGTFCNGEGTTAQLPWFDRRSRLRITANNPGTILLSLHEETLGRDLATRRLVFISDAALGAGISSERRYDLGLSLGALTVGDVDGDGWLDVVALDSMHHVARIAAGGPEGLTPSDTLSVQGRPEALLLADLDGDEAPELVLASPDLGRVTIYSRAGGQWMAVTEVGSLAYPRGLAAADVRPTAGLEVLVATSNDHRIAVLEGLVSGGTEVSMRDYSPVGAPSPGSARLPIAVLRPRGDWSDGPLLGVAINAGSNDLAVWGLEGALEGRVARSADNPVGAVAVDFLGDEADEVMVAGNCIYAPCLMVHQGMGCAQLDLWLTPTALAAGDLDGDGQDDIAVVGDPQDGANETGGKLMVFLHSGSADLDGGCPSTFPGDLPQSVEVAIAARPRGVALADLDRDGRAEIVTSHWDGTLRVRRLDATADDPVTTLPANP